MTSSPIPAFIAMKFFDRRYVYGMRLRGFSPGAQPKNGLLHREDSPNSEYYDLIVYDRPLTDEEMGHYSLDFIREEQGWKLKC